MDAQAVFNRSAACKVPDFGCAGLLHGAQVINNALEAGEKFAEMVSEVRAELRNEMKQALAGEREFLPGYVVDVSGRKKERLVGVHDALMEALEHGQNSAVLVSMLSGRGAHVVNLITLREGVIDAYADLNCEEIAQARMERLS